MAISAKKGFDKKERMDKNAKPLMEKKGIGNASHPVFGSGKLHPVHDDKVIGKFKNADKIKNEVKEIDELEEDELQEELEEIATENQEKVKTLNKLRTDTLTKIQEQKQKLSDSKISLEKGLDSNPITEAFNRLGLFINDAQMKQVESQEANVTNEIDTNSERLAVLELLKSYIDSKQ